MLIYLRLFTIASLIAMTLVAGLVGLYFRGQVSANVRDLGQTTNIAAARHFNVEIWARHHDYLSKGQATDQFKEDMGGYLHNAQVVGIRVYSEQGALLYTTGGTLSAAEFGQKVQAARSSSLQVVSEMTTAGDTGLQTVNGAQLDVIRSFITLGGGYVELFTDVTSPWMQLKVVQWIIIVSIVLVFLFLLLSLYIIYQKAESIIAKQHERTMELEATAASAQEETRQKSQFLASISHELRTPLNAIIGFSDIIKNEMMGEVKNPQFPGYITDIHSSGVHLLSLINDILDFSKAEAGKLELEVEEINASKLAANCLRLVQPRAEAAGVELVNAMPKEHFVIETDGKKFKQVLLNLMSNAVKFTPSGGKVKVTGWQDLATDTFVFQVSDSGIGIAQKDIAKAMAPFGQVDSALSRKYEGTGLGLPLTKKFIELMGGKFSIQSEINVGTTITFSIPRVFKQVDGVVVKKAS